METKTLKSWRIANGYTTKFIADKLGLSVYTYRRKENGKASFKLVEQQILCELYGIGHDQIEAIK